MRARQSLRKMALDDAQDRTQKMLSQRSMDGEFSVKDPLQAWCGVPCGEV